MSRLPKARSAGGPSAHSTMTEPPGATSKSKLKSSKSNLKPVLPKESKIQAMLEEELALPPFSVALKATKSGAVDKKKQKMIRRNKPQGEDLPKLKEIMKSLKTVQISLPEFLSLIGPSTGDDCELLRKVWAEDLKLFRITATKIYETMTQDVSEVLTNEHIQLTESSQERVQMYTDKMMRTINEIYQLCPDFNFDDYYTKEGYLGEKFPVVEYQEKQGDEYEALQRQEAYHRYQWLKTEGDRLKEENTKLQKRLSQLKKRQQREAIEAAKKEQELMNQKLELENQQEDLEEKLEELNDSVEKSIVEAEKAASPLMPQLVRLEKKLPAKGKILSGKRKQTSWAAETAADLESSAIVQNVAAEGSRISVRAKESLSKIKKRTKAKAKKQEEAFHYSPIKTPPRAPPAPKERSPFHFSPIKTPPRAPPESKERSPFHFSPTKPQSPQYYDSLEQSVRSPTRGERSRIQYAPQEMAEAQEERMGASRRAPYSSRSPPRRDTEAQEETHPVRIERTTSRLEEAPPQDSRFGRSRAQPRDSWGGFY